MRMDDMQLKASHNHSWLLSGRRRHLELPSATENIGPMTAGHRVIYWTRSESDFGTIMDPGQVVYVT